MQQAGQLKILFALNPVSGGKSNQNWEVSIREYFKDLQHTIEIFMLGGENDGESLQHYINTIRPDRVVAVGGDGTVQMAAKQLLGSGIPLGILPAGSANGMAKELDIPNTPVEALDIVVNGMIRAADVIRINKSEICLHLSDIGLNAKLIKYFEQSNWRGKLGYARVLFKALRRKRTMRVLIDLNGEKVERDAFMIVLANASKYGTGAVINPKGNLYDGLFEVVIIRKFSIGEIFKMFIEFLPLNPRKTEIIPATSVVINTYSNAHFQIDGEYLGKVKQVEASIVPGQLNLLIPQEINK
ncbi:MAG: diacylglycerol kinase family lipid kinase [Chitinophagaceae bacterium]|nr:diacylglycerol kinase family lipid kinase [Chitinophagaceae bacterium]